MKCEAIVKPYPEYKCDVCEPDTIRQDCVKLSEGYYWRYRCEKCGLNSGWCLTKREAYHSFAVNKVARLTMTKAVEGRPDFEELRDWINAKPNAWIP